MTKNDRRTGSFFGYCRLPGGLVGSPHASGAIGKGRHRPGVCLTVLVRVQGIGYISVRKDIGTLLIGIQHMLGNET